MLEEIRKTLGWLFVVGLIIVLVFLLALQSIVLLQFFPPTPSLTGLQGKKLATLTLEGPIFQIQDHLDQLRQFREDQSVKGLLIEVDSPGGAVGPSQELSAAVERFTQTGRPAVTAIRSVGASGAYYVAASSDTIVANPGSLVGSIGVVIQFMEFKDLMGKIGVDYHVVKSGRFKDLGSPFREMTPRERKILRELIMNTYEQFLNHLLEQRPVLNREELKKIADGRILTGTQALERGLLDRVGNRQEALSLLREAAGVSEDVPLWNPQSREFSFVRNSRQLLRPLLNIFESRGFGIKLLYIMPNWGAKQ